MIQSLNPANGKLLRSFDALTPDALNAKLAIASSAAKTYPSETIDQRIFWMRRLAALLEADIEELASIMTAEMGKTLVSARAEVTKCVGGCRFYADNAARILAPERVITEHPESYVRYDPLGVILAVMPWNFPLWQVFRFLAPALMAGNVGLLKHASNVPQCALAIEALVRRAGFPRGVFQTLLIEARQVEHLLNDPRVAAVTVTGSRLPAVPWPPRPAGSSRRPSLELGGSDPFIVLPSADLDAAIATRRPSPLRQQRSKLHRRQALHRPRQHLYRVRKALRRRHGRPPHRRPHARIHRYRPPRHATDPRRPPRPGHTRARESGGRVLTGGGRAFVENGKFGNYFQPTVIAGVMRNAPICQEELFGPVALLFRVSSLDEAIALANDTPFGLSASAWTTDDAERQRLASSSNAVPSSSTPSRPATRDCPSAASSAPATAASSLPSACASSSTPKLSSSRKSRLASATTPKPNSNPLPPPSHAPTNPPNFKHYADQLRKFEPNKASSLATPPTPPAPLPAVPLSPTQSDPIATEPPAPEPSQLKPEAPTARTETSHQPGAAPSWALR